MSQLHDPLAIVGAILFTVIMAFSALHSSRRKDSSLWTMIFATMLQAGGCAAYAIHSQNLSNHLAFLISFSTINITPCFLAISSILTFKRYISSIMSAEQLADPMIQAHIKSGSRLLVSLQGLILAVLNMCLYDMGSYLSPQPIDGVNGAMQRLAHFERGVQLLTASHVLQMLYLSAFSIFTVTWSWRSSTWSRVETFGDAQSKRRNLLGAISAINILCIYRNAYKLSQYVAVESTSVQLVESRALFWLCDAMPILIALIVLCSTFSESQPQQEDRQKYTYTPVPEIKIICVDEEIPLSFSKS